MVVESPRTRRRSGWQVGDGERITVATVGEHEFALIDSRRTTAHWAVREKRVPFRLLCYVAFLRAPPPLPRRTVDRAQQGHLGAHGIRRGPQRASSAISRLSMATATSAALRLTSSQPPKLLAPKPAALCEEHHIVLAATPVACGHSQDHRSCVVARNQGGDHVTPGQLRCARMRKSSFRGGHGIRCVGR